MTKGNHIGASHILCLTARAAQRRQQAGSRQGVVANTRTQRHAYAHLPKKRYSTRAERIEHTDRERERRMRERLCFPAASLPWLQKGGVVNVDFVSTIAPVPAPATLNSNDPQKGCVENGRSCCHRQRITVAADKNEGKGI